MLHTLPISSFLTWMETNTQTWRWCGLLYKVRVKAVAYMR
jgi:hypothetical protein